MVCWVQEELVFRDLNNDGHLQLEENKRRKWSQKKGVELEERPTD